MKDLIKSITYFENGTDKMKTIEFEVPQEIDEEKFKEEYGAIWVMYMAEE